MSKAYDAIIIGGGHNGLVNAAYLARAGKKVLVLERRHVLGGAAVTEEIFPGFKFSVCSYVVSLLRPEIIRELDLPRHGLEILPLDGTFTPMPDGDHLWRMSDHARTRREIYRHSPARRRGLRRVRARRWWTWRASSSRSSPWCRPTPTSSDVPGFSATSRPWRGASRS